MRIVQFVSTFVLLSAFLSSYCSTVAQEFVCHESTECRGGRVEVVNSLRGDCCDGRGLSFSLNGRCTNCFSMEEFCNDGSEFYVAFFSNLEIPLFFSFFSPPKTAVMLNNMEPTVQTVDLQYKSGEKRVTIDAGSSQEVTFEASERFIDPGDTENGVTIRSEDGAQLSVTAFVSDYSSSDTYQLLSCVFLPAKYEYYALSVARDNVVDEDEDEDDDPLGNSTLAYIAMEDGTTVTLTPSQDVQFQSQGTIMAGASISHTLGKGEAVFIESKEDLSGTHVVSNKPLAFFSGHECGNMPSDRSFCDHMVEQIPPTVTWGTEFYTGSFMTGLSITRYRVVSSRHLTSVNWSCTEEVSGSINIPIAGEVVEFEIPINTFCRFSSTLPVLLFEFTVGGETMTTTDPSMALVPPVGQYRHSYVLNYFPGGSGSKNFVNIFLPNTPGIETSGVQLNGGPVGGTWTNIPCGDDSDTICAYGIQVELNGETVVDGTVTLLHTNPEALLLGMPYSTDTRTGRSSFGGMTQKPIALDTVSLSGAEYFTEEGDSEVTVTIIRNGSLLDNLTVLFVAAELPTAPTAAIANEDFMELRMEVNMPAGESQFTMAISLGPDDIFPGDDKVFQVYLGPAPGAFVSPIVQANVTILDNDPDLPVMNISFMQTSYTVNERNGLLEIILTKSEGAIGPVTVALTPVSINATSDADYQLEGMNITFQVSETQKVVYVPITNDDTVEDSEIFTIVITPVPGLFPLDVVNGIADVLILDDDILVVAFQPSSLTVRESDGRVRCDMVIVKGSTDIDIEVFPTDIVFTASIERDYSVLTEAVTFSSEVTRGTIDVQIQSDTVCETKETFGVQVFVDEGFIDQIQVLNYINITIIDDDCDNLMVVVAVNSTVVMESVGEVVVRLSIDPGEVEGGSVTLAVSTAPISGQQQPFSFDVLTQRQVTLTGSDSNTIRIGIRDDTEFNEQERVFAVDIAILRTTYDKISLSDNFIEIRIVDDDTRSRDVICNLLGDQFSTFTKESCCLGGGESFEQPPYSIPCIVIGFQEAEYTLVRRIEPYDLIVEVQPVGSLAQNITVTVIATPITADASDYRVVTPWVRLVDGGSGITQVAISTEQGQGDDDQLPEGFRLDIIEESGIVPNNVFFRGADVTIFPITDQP